MDHYKESCHEPRNPPLTQNPSVLPSIERAGALHVAIGSEGETSDLGASVAWGDVRAFLEIQGFLDHASGET